MPWATSLCLGGSSSFAKSKFCCGADSTANIASDRLRFSAADAVAGLGHSGSSVNLLPRMYAVLYCFEAGYRSRPAAMAVWIEVMRVRVFQAVFSRWRKRRLAAGCIGDKQTATRAQMVRLFVAGALVPRAGGSYRPAEGRSKYKTVCHYRKRSEVKAVRLRRHTIHVWAPDVSMST
jgi:hypothetical protein